MICLHICFVRIIILVLYVLFKNIQRVSIGYRRSLALLSTLFTDQNLSKNTDFGFEETLDAKSLTKMFNRVAERYCEDIQGINTTICNAKSCTDLSCNKETEACIPDSGNAYGHICAGMVIDTVNVQGLDNVYIITYIF